MVVLVVSAVSGIDVIGQAQELWEIRIGSRVEGFTARVTDIDQSRPNIWALTIDRLRGRPDVVLIGTGFQNFNNLKAGLATAAHNQYLHTLVELGIVGFLVFMQMLIHVGRSLEVARENSPTMLKGVPLAARNCLFAILALGVFNESFYPSRAIMGFMGFALAYFAISMHSGWRADGRASRRSRNTPGTRNGRVYVGWATDQYGPQP